MDIRADEFREAEAGGLLDLGDGPGAVGAEIDFLGDGAVFIDFVLLAEDESGGFKGGVFDPRDDFPK